MNIIETPNENSFSEEVMKFFLTFLQKNNNPLLTLPTGTTPLPFYKKISEEYKDNKELNKFTYLSLDEYYGLEQEDKRLFANWLDREILSTLEVPSTRRITIDSSCENVQEHCLKLEKKINMHGNIDLAIIGLGNNGHIGFNEPGSDLNSRTRKVHLTKETIAANAVYWGSLERVPKSAITLGIGTLKEAKHTLLLARGFGKAKILRDTFKLSISNKVPSTYLQEQRNLTIIADTDALSMMHT